MRFKRSNSQPRSEAILHPELGNLRQSKRLPVDLSRKNDQRVLSVLSESLLPRLSRTTRQSKLEITQQSFRLSFRPSKAESHRKDHLRPEPVLPKIEDADEESRNSQQKVPSFREAELPSNQLLNDHGILEESCSGAGVRESEPGWAPGDEDGFFTRKTSHNDELMREISFNTLTQNT